ncbi:MAG: helix-turn-helix domain-containing protein [Azoarcus sp.]|jgi:transposase|nr:helix-turn-helix domain-containing protein [Azoarcus sp.]
MRKRRIPPLEISAAEREQITALAACENTPQARAVASRARAILACADGVKTKDVAVAEHVSSDLVSKWKIRFILYRIEGLYDARLMLSDAEREQLEALKHQDKTFQDRALAMRARALLAYDAGEDFRGIADSLGVSIPTVSRWRDYFLQSRIDGLLNTRVILSAGERRHLMTILDQGASFPRLAQRARIILACAEGEDIEAIAARENISAATAAKWRTRFALQRVAGLEDVTTTPEAPGNDAPELPDDGMPEP